MNKEYTIISDYYSKELYADDDNGTLEVVDINTGESITLTSDQNILFEIISRDHICGHISYYMSEGNRLSDDSVTLSDILESTSDMKIWEDEVKPMWKHYTLSTSQSQKIKNRNNTIVNVGGCEFNFLDRGQTETRIEVYGIIVNPTKTELESLVLSLNSLIENFN